MRGIPRGGLLAEDAAGISPAHAGNTKNNGWKGVGYKDQPRTCGEYPRRRDSEACHVGSAPHMRGIQGAGSADCRSQGDQPRTCGEYSPWSAPACVSRGSAPHMRGIPVTRPSVLGIRGISPAHAGNTVAVSFVSPGIWDQPRTCGEYTRWAPRLTPSSGSAPHMRGILGRVARAVRVRRISPAHAGNTYSDHVTRAGGADQPRTCGEYLNDADQAGSTEGSAPHMRGIHSPSLADIMEWGISPAHAGNTRSKASRILSRPDQPRTCGEYWHQPSLMFFLLGSAPHMRGILKMAQNEITVTRISPAHAGNTLCRAIRGRQ